ncbi:hypothetical protein ACFLVQ_00645 [Chloroflexota bacterium]
MRSIFSAALVSMVLMSLILGMSPALAQTERNIKEGVAVSTEAVSGNKTARQVITVNTVPMEEMDRLVKMLEEAENENDDELVEALQEKIRVIKEEISEVEKETIKPQLAAEEPVRVAPREVTAVNVASTDKCDELKTWESKKARYEAVYALSDEELKDKGYSGGKEEIRKIISELDAGIQRLRIECEAGVTTRTSSGGVAPTTLSKQTAVAVALRPTAVESAVEITDYYRYRIAEISAEEAEIERQIASLKELRGEIDRLIEELIKSKDEISTEELSGLVTKIEVRPGEVKMDNAVVKTVAKSVMVRVNSKDLEIKPTVKNVIIRDKNLEVQAAKLSIEDEVLKAGDFEVKVMPSTVIEKIRVEPKEIRLEEEDARAVYKIKTDESRKLLGLIPVNVEKTLTVDALDTEVGTVDEEGPWWAFLTTK